jgi:pyruvate dehydrogenase E2 component (dihydrolipoamide acetyltransferase)
MSREMRFTDPGEGIHEAEVVEVLVNAGDSVQEGDSVLAVETDKATTELPAAYGGEIEQLAVAVGDRVEVGDLLLTFAGDSDEAPDESAPAAQRPDPEPEPEPARAEPEQAEPEQATPKQAQSKQGAPEQTEAQQPETRRDDGGDGASHAPKRPHKGPVPAAPSTRRLARELGVALAQVAGSGPGGRVLDADVRGASEASETADTRQAERAEAPGSPERPATTEPEQPQPERGAAKPAPAASAEPLPDFSRWGDVERVELRSVRRATAREMARAWAEIPHVMHHDRADVTALERFRRAHVDEVAAAGGKLTLTVLVLKAAAAALRVMPRFNASLDADGETIVLKHYCHIGVAVATDAGLLVPVVRDVDRKSVRELAVELAELARRARDGELSREEMQGGSFTVTNVGGIGGRLFTPIIRYPEAAILGLARAELAPVVTGDIDAPKIGARLYLPLCFAFDHRLNDGAEAARFVNRIIDSLQDPESLLLSV